jgi:hypothetical protein
MGFGDRWGQCLHTMGMPTPTEAWDDVQEAFDKLHEADTELGGWCLSRVAVHRVG